MGNFKEDIALVKAFAFDVDGVMTDGGITPLPGGDFIRTYNAKDGYAMAYALQAGYKICIITAGRGALLEERFRSLGVTEYHCNVYDKLTVFREFIDRHGFTRNEVLYMGDDLPDLTSMQYSGMPICPADAVPEIVEASRYVSQFAGGKGCIRDIIEQVLRAHGVWAKHTFGVTTVQSR